jgi:DNA-binding Lrp family transcriptional regulator
MKIIEITGGDEQIRLLTRNGANGPEKELVDFFMKYIPQCFHWQKGAVAIFHEPRMETGFPDLVIVQYLPEVFEHWVAARSALSPVDLKILHYLSNVQGADASTLMATLGIAAKPLLSSIERLLDAGLITRYKTKWRAEALNHIFGVRSIVAVEAKIKNWSDAFHQSQLNLWFASEAYILSPVEKPSQSIMSRSRDSGIGIFLLNGNHVRRAQGTQKNDIPSSYGSWMFNEWIGRYLHR